MERDDASCDTTFADVPPGPKGRFLIGKALDFSWGDWLRFFVRCAREQGDVVSFRFPNVPMYLLTHPDDIEDAAIYLDSGISFPA
jgi:hypothetical protein